MVSTGRRGSPPERIGQMVLKALATRRPRARYAVGSANPLIWLAQHLVSKRGIDRMLAARLGLSPRP